MEPSTHVLQVTTLPQAGVVVIKPFNPILKILCSSLYDVLLISVFYALSLGICRLQGTIVLHHYTPYAYHTS
ncbi:MAG: hypothetical protein HA494_07760, partial [Thaumarchaeota archaeon]|nr:hypothetical protein [Nitrososphaerota archaeon]